MELSKVCASLIKIDSTIQSLLFNWHWLACENMYKFSYPEKISGSTLYVCVLSSQSSFFMHYSQRILDNVCAFLGSRRVQKISVKQVFSMNLSNREYGIKNSSAESLNKNLTNDLSYTNFEKVFKELENRDDIFSTIDEKLSASANLNMNCDRANGLDDASSNHDSQYDSNSKNGSNADSSFKSNSESKSKSNSNRNSKSNSLLNSALKRLYCAMVCRENLQKKFTKKSIREK